MVEFDLRKLFRVPTPEQRLAGLALRPDLAAAVGVMVTDERSDRDLQQVARMLRLDESVAALVEGRCERLLGLLALTTRRVFFRPHGARTDDVQELPLSQVRAVDSETGRMTGRVTVRGVLGGECVEVQDVGVQDVGVKAGRGHATVFVVDKILGTQAGDFAATARRLLGQS